MMKIGGRYNWKGQAERLSYMGCRRYPGDSRGWHQFEKIDCPGIVWCEVLEADLPMLEETVDAYSDTFKKGDRVRLTDNRWPGQSTTVRMVERGGVRLATPLAGFYHWNEADLELAE